MSDRRELAWLVLPTLFLLVVVPFDLVPWLRGPAPYPPEWQWEYRVPPAGSRVLPALAVGAGLVGLIVLAGTAWARARAGRAAALILVLATLLGWLFPIALLEVEPAGGLRTLMARTLSRTVTSYHTAALSPGARDPISFLRSHADLLAEFRTEAKHAATHPPGPVLFYRGLIGLCESSPALTRVLLRAADENEDRPPPTRAPRAAALLGALILGLLGAATAWPVAVLARQAGAPPLAAARVGTLWGLLPGPALMAPQFDQALALPVAAAAALLASTRPRHHSAAKAVLAGLLGAVAFFVSYGAVVFLLIAGGAALVLNRDLRVAGLAAITAVAVVTATALLGHEPLRSALTALTIHREVYTAPRSYLLWLFFNPIDLSLFLGLPVATLLARSQGRLALAASAGLTLLLLSGATRGEVGRIWIPLMPILLVAALADSGEGEPSPKPAILAGALLVPFDLVIRLFWRL